MNGNPANPVLTAHLTAGSYTLKIRASSGKTYANAHLAPDSIKPTKAPHPVGLLHVRRTIMANTPNQPDHKAVSPSIPGLTVERTKAIVLLIVQLFSVAQTGLSIAGISQLPFTSDQVSTRSPASSPSSHPSGRGGRNNNVTTAAVQGQQLTNALKANIVATTTDTTGEATQVAHAVSDSKGADATADVAPIEEVTYGDGE